MRTLLPVAVISLIGSLPAVGCSGTGSDGEYLDEPEEARVSVPRGEKIDFALHLFDPAAENFKGEMVSLRADLLREGRPVVVNFWATWCGPCVVELPYFEEVARRRADLTVTTVAVSDTTDYFPRFVERSGLSLPVLMDSEGRVSEALKASMLPSTLLFDPDGHLILRHVGSFISPNDLEEVLDLALSENRDRSIP
jgi:thiol-disulfide isomerase/thioredoxin